MNNVIVVLIDTNVFDGLNYDFNNGQLKYLEEYVVQGNIELWIHNISIREAKSHIKAKITEFVNSLNSNKVSNNILMTDNKYKKIFESFKIEFMIQDGVKALDDYLTRTKAKILSNCGVSIDDIMDDYFSQRPPFGVDKKKNEFPDAIMISSIKKELSGIDELHIVSSDEDWNKSFVNERKVTVYKTLKEFLNFYNKQNEIRDEVVKYFSDFEVAESTSCTVKNLLDDFSFEVVGQFSDDSYLVYNQYCEEITNQFTKKTKCDSLYVEYIDPKLWENDSKGEISGIVKVHMDSTAIIELECGYFNQEESIWDPEEKEYIHRAIDYICESHEIEFSTKINLKVTFNKDKKLNFNIENIQLEDVPDKLSFQNLISIDDERDETFKVTKTYKCPKCGKIIKIELVEKAIMTNVHDRKMGYETEYILDFEDACFNCKNEYKITGSIFEYPSNILNHDDTDIVWKNNSKK